MTFLLVLLAAVLVMTFVARLYVSRRAERVPVRVRAVRTYRR